MYVISWVKKKWIYDCLSRLYALFLHNNHLGPVAAPLQHAYYVLCGALLIVREKSLLIIMSNIYWLFTILQWSAKCLYELVRVFLQITQWGRYYYCPLCRLTNKDLKRLTKLPQDSHLIKGWGMREWNTHSQTHICKTQNYILNAYSDHLEYVEQLDILCLGRRHQTQVRSPLWSENYV